MWRGSARGSVVLAVRIPAAGLLCALSLASLSFGCAARAPAPEPLRERPVLVLTTPDVVLAPPQAGAVTSEGPDPTAVDTLVWGNVSDSPGIAPKPRTYWLRASPTTYDVKGQSEELLIAHGQRVWRWVVREYEHKVACGDAASREQLGPTSTSLGLRLEPVGAPGGMDVIAGDASALPCESIRSPAITLEGSVGSYLFIRDYRELYGGGAHGIVLQSFLAYDLATGKDWGSWSREVIVPTADVEALKHTLGQPPGPRGSARSDPYVQVSPASLKSSYGLDGALSLRVCFTVADTNIPELAPMLSHGAVELGDCIVAPTPARFSVDAAAPSSVARFARTHHLTVGGWSRLSGGTPLPPAAQALFAREM